MVQSPTTSIKRDLVRLTCRYWYLAWHKQRKPISLFLQMGALRGYQKEALAHIEKQSTILVLPTGSGKTIIAAKAVETSFRTTGKPSLFLVPTQLLVTQQWELLTAETPHAFRVAKFHGELAVPEFDELDTLVATPAAFLAQQENKDLALNTFGMVVFDEVHHVVKNHPYRKVALLTQKIPEGSRPKVLGLTASMTYAVNSGAQSTVHTLCTVLFPCRTCPQAAFELETEAPRMWAPNVWRGKAGRGTNRWRCEWLLHPGMIAGNID